VNIAGNAASPKVILSLILTSTFASDFISHNIGQQIPLANVAHFVLVKKRTKKMNSSESI
jgi:hypothetical protein